MSLDTAVFKFNNIYTFSAQFQKYIKSFNNVYSKKFDKIKDLSILNTISSNINISLDIVRSRDELDINYAIANSSLSFENYEIDHIISVYKSILDKLVTPINNITYLFNNNTSNIGLDFTTSNSNKLLCDLLNEIRHKNNPKQIIDIYISEYMNVPKSSENIVNFIYFIRRFPLIRFLLNHYFYKHIPHYFNIIQEHKLDNINYLLFKERRVTYQALQDLSKTGLFDFDFDYDEYNYNTEYSRILNSNFTFDGKFDNTFISLCNGCKNRELKRYNTISAIENNNKIESVIYLFPFLYNLNNIFLLKNVLKTVIEKIKRDNIGVIYFQDRIYIKDPKEIFYTIIADSQRILDINTGFELGSIGRDESILRHFILLFAYDMVINQINVENVFVNLSLEDILIKMSTFILNTYGVFKRAGLEEQENFYNTIQFDPARFVPLNVEENEDASLPGANQFLSAYNTWYRIVVPNEPRNITYFYLFAANLLFKNIPFRTLVEDDLYKMSHLFYIFNYFHNDAKDINPLFIFAGFSDAENKWIKNYNYKKNYFLDWLIEYFDYCFPKVKTFVFN